MRGRVARIQINSAEIVKVLKINITLSIIGIATIAVSKVLEISLIAKILIYSAIKIKANKPLLYSTLNPDTSSDSPSAKSNGVRLVSAKLVINHRVATTGRIITTQDI
jgi:hypothetical protein